MPKREIEEEDFQKLVKAAQGNDEALRARALLAELNGHPESRRQFERALKANPKFADIETEDDIVAKHRAPVLDELNKVKEELGGKLKVFEDRFADFDKSMTAAESEAAFKRVQSSYRFTEEGMAKVREIATTRKIDPDSAAAVFARDTAAPAASQSAYEPQPAWKMPGAAAAEDAKALFQNPERWGDETALKVLNELRQPAAA